MGVLVAGGAYWTGVSICRGKDGELVACGGNEQVN